MERKILPFFSCVFLALLVAPALAAACSVCVTGDNDPTSNAFNWSVLFLIATPYTVVGSIAGWLFYKYRRAAGRLNDAEAGRPALKLTWNQEESSR